MLTFGAKVCVLSSRIVVSVTVLIQSRINKTIISRTVNTVNEEPLKSRDKTRHPTRRLQLTEIRLDKVYSNKGKGKFEYLFTFLNYFLSCLYHDLSRLIGQGAYWI